MKVNFINSSVISSSDVLVDLSAEGEYLGFNERNIVNVPILNPKGYKNSRKYYKNNNTIMMYLIILLQVSCKLPGLIKRFKVLYTKTLIKNSNLVLIETDNRITNIIYMVLRLSGINCLVLAGGITTLNTYNELRV